MIIDNDNRHTAAAYADSVLNIAVAGSVAVAVSVADADADVDVDADDNVALDWQSRSLKRGGREAKTKAKTWGESKRRIGIQTKTFAGDCRHKHSIIQSE